MRLNPPTASNASLRTIDEQARNPRIDGPGSAGSWPSALPASRSDSSSTRPLGSTTVRAASNATVGCRAKISSARAVASGAHHESSSQNAT